MATGLHRVLSLLAAALAAYFLAQVGGPVVATIPLAIGALLSLAMHAAIRRAPASAWQKQSSRRDKLAGFAFFTAAFVIPSLAIGMTGLRQGPLVTFASILGAVWLILWGFSLATRIGGIRRRQIA